MKVLVVYFTQTGNIEKIASAIYDEASQMHETILKTSAKKHFRWNTIEFKS